MVPRRSRGSGETRPLSYFEGAMFKGRSERKGIGPVGSRSGPIRSSPVRKRLIHAGSATRRPLYPWFRANSHYWGTRRACTKRCWAYGNGRCCIVCYQRTYGSASRSITVWTRRRWKIGWRIPWSCHTCAEIWWRACFQYTHSRSIYHRLYGRYVGYWTETVRRSSIRRLPLAGHEPTVHWSQSQLLPQ